MAHSTIQAETPRSETLAGILWMLAAMFGFATEDVFIKFVAATVPTWQILAMLGAAGAAIFWLWAAARHRPVLNRDIWLMPILIRNAGEVVGTICFVTAIATIPLASASAILQATPLAVTLGAAAFLGARVGWRRWTAIAAGFAGVLLILRPGTETFQPASLFAVGAVIGLSARDLATRAAPVRIASEVLAAQSFALVAVAGLLLAPFGAAPVLPGLPQLAALAGAVVTGVAAYYAITSAMRVGDITVVTPFRYSRLLFALVFALLLFGERPDATTLIGAAIVIGSGLYTFARESRQRRATLPTTSPPG